jgi:hypothetical protein
MVNVLTTGAVKQREVTDPITTAAALYGRLTPGFSSTVWRPAPPLGGHLPAVATLRRHTLARWSEAVDVPSDIVKRLSLSAITTGRTPVHVPMPTAINHRFASTSP